MTEEKLTLYQRFEQKIHHYYFEYPDRRPLNLHESHLNQTVLMALRIVGFVYISGIYIWALIEMPTFNTNIIYLTMLGYTSTWLYFALSLQDYFINSKPQSPLSQKLIQVVEIVYEIALCTQIPITLIFWTLLFKIVLDMPNVTTSEIILQSNLHAVPLLFLVLDFTHNTFSFHIRHVSILVIFTVIYLIINMSYSLSVKPIYKPIPWNDVASYIISIGCILAVLLIHYIARVIFRKWKLKKLQQKDYFVGKLLEKSDYSQLSQQNSGKQNTTFRKSVVL